MKTQNRPLSFTDENGNIVVSYSYDPWGVITDIEGDFDLGYRINPFRYKSYYYDYEIQWYYLQSRYYFPDFCRFINCDDVNYIGINETEISYNPFAYCENEPVKNSDPWGNISGVIEFTGILAYLLIAIAAFICYYSLSVILYSILSRIDYNRVISVISPLWNLPLSRIKQKMTTTKALMRVLTFALNRTLTIAKADARIRSKVKQKSKTRYWRAYRKSNYVEIGSPLTFEQAVVWVRAGNSVFALSKDDALKLAKSAGFNQNPMYHPKHQKSLGYYNHYHIAGHANGAHIWFL